MALKPAFVGQILLTIGSVVMAYFTKSERGEGVDRSVRF